MKNYALSLLLLQHLCLHTITSAEVHTFTQKDPKSYIGDPSNIPGDIGPDDIDVQDDGALRFTFGPELSKRMLETTKKYCKDDPESDDCIKKTQEVMGIGPSANGIQKRVIGILVAAGGVALAYGTWKLWTYITDRLEASMTGKVIHIEIPKDQKEAMTKWEAGGDDKFLYKPQNGEPVEVKINNEQPAPKDAAEIKKEDNGDITVSLPGNVIPGIEDSWSRSGCGRTGLKRGLEKRVTLLDLARCIQAMIRVGQLGGPAGAIQYVDPTMFPKMTEPLIIEAYDDAKNYSKTMYYGKNAPDKVDERVAKLSTWLSAAHEIGQINFRDGKMVISAAFLKEQKEPEDDDDEEKSCPKGDDRVFCTNCGGNAKKNDKNRPDSAKPKLGSCKGLPGGGLKGCECFQDSRHSIHGIEPKTQKLAGEVLDDLEDEEDDDNKKFEYNRNCYKQDKEWMKDRKNWKFIQQVKLDEAIKTFCDEWKMTDSDKEITTERVFFDEDDSDWDTVRFTVTELKGGMFNKDRCRRLFQSISSCDYDKNDEESKRLNQFNFKWGGEIRAEDGVFLTVEPIHGRVHHEDNTNSFFRSSRSCVKKDGFTIKNDGKGNNGKPLDEAAQMALQMCIHQMLYADKVDYDCAGLLYVKMKRRVYNSRSDCFSNTWKCLSHYVDSGWTAKAAHTPGFASCRTHVLF